MKLTKQLLILFCLLLTSCFLFHLPARAAETKKLNVIATIFPVFDFARQVGGDNVNVTKLLPSGVEAHTFEPKPQDVVRIAKADVFIYTGNAMEPWVEDLLRGISNPRLVIVDASKDIHMMRHEHHDESGDADSHEHSESNDDPHIWLDLTNAQRMVKTIASAFVSRDPVNQTYYEQNAVAYQLKLVGLDKQFHDKLSACKTKTIIHAGHFAFGYFAKRYSLSYMTPYLGFSPNAEPSPKNIKVLVDAVRKTNSSYIYYEELIDPKIARVISQETGAKLVLLNGAHNVTNEELKRGVTFLSIMNDNLQNLEKGLQCQL